MQLIFLCLRVHITIWLICIKDGNYLKAFLYKEKSDSLLEVTRNAELQKQLLDLQNKYENDKLILENKQIRLENEKQTYFYLYSY